MSKKTLARVMTTAGLAAIVAGCAHPGNRTPHAPYIVAPGHSSWNLGAGFMNTAGGLPSPHGSEQQKRECRDLSWENGNKYSGEVIRYSNGLYNAHGQGVFNRFNGDRYEGGFWHGKFHGKGKYTSKNGKVWEGRFENGKFLGNQISSSK